MSTPLWRLHAEPNGRKLDYGEGASGAYRMVRRIFIHLGVLCLLVAGIHSLVWFAQMNPDLYYAIPVAFLTYLGVSFILAACVRPAKNPGDDHDA